MAVVSAPGVAGVLPAPVIPLDGGPAAVLAAPAPVAAPDPLKKAGLRYAAVRIDGPLETSLVTAVGKELGAALTQVVTRSLVWWVSVPGDLRKGDAIDVLFEERAGEEPVVHAVRFVSGKFEKTFQAFRFKPTGEPFARFYQPSGEELEQRIQDSPLDSYEQITSLLKDGRKHKGVDFKTPINSPVKATFAGTITRKNWGFHGNGNCFELTENGGKKKAFFLHLTELPKTLQVGRHVAKGEVLASSGNTGHSFAPHLHYQLMSCANDKVLDPFEVHPTYRRALPPAQKPTLDAEISRMTALMSQKMAGN